MTAARTRNGLWSRRFKNYLQAALLLTAGYQLAWHKDALNGHPGRALLALGVLVVGVVIVIAALKTKHTAWIIIGMVVCVFAGAYTSSLFHGVKWSSLWIVGLLLALLVLTEIVVRDHLPFWMRGLRIAKKLPWFIPRAHLGQRQPRASQPNDASFVLGTQHPEQ